METSRCKAAHFSVNVQAQTTTIAMPGRDSTVSNGGSYGTQGIIQRVVYNPHTDVVHMSLHSPTGITPVARLRISQLAKASGVGACRPAGMFRRKQGAWGVPLGAEAARIILNTNATPWH